jgi:hypothetical protein
VPLGGGEIPRSARAAKHGPGCRRVMHVRKRDECPWWGRLMDSGRVGMLIGVSPWRESESLQLARPGVIPGASHVAGSKSCHQRGRHP